MPKNKTARTPTTAMKLDMDEQPEENGAEDQGDGSADQNGTKTSSKKDMLISADSYRIVSANYGELFQKFIDQGVDACERKKKSCLPSSEKIRQFFRSVFL